MNIPVAHIQGGEVTGTIDESLRHAMSKFAHYHLVSNEDAKERLIKMGEVPDNVFVVGCPSIDALLEVNDVSDEDLQQEFGIDFTEPYFIVIQHPVTTEFEQSEFQIQTTLGAIKESNAQALFIYPNNDAGAQNIIKTLKKSKIKHVPTLSLEKYVSLLRRSAGLIGNSSSGIHETATLSVPTINIGSRQQGRLRPTNVVDVEHNQTQIVGAIDRCLNDDEFLETVKTCTNPYGDGLSAKKIVDILKTIDISDNIIQKQITY
jgi:UDP-N-acetylglucosamine 2-epimerase (non-hydrolysing)/GDP/UDP-N,N'-diacetylbacillosamine 2-epimerase (hydrolysing)